MPNVSPFLIIGHPGHELGIHHWLETARPRVFVLTDGSGLDGASRLEACRTCLEAVGAEPGGVFGPLTDRGWYQALLAADPNPLKTCGRAVMAEAVELGPTLIVSDGLEGQEPLHDLAFFLADAVSRALTRRGRRVEHRSVPVSGPLRQDRPLSQQVLDEAALDRKWAAATGYAGMEQEVRLRMAEPGFRLDRERLHAPEPEPGPEWLPDYEMAGREGVDRGRWAEAIEYARHVRPAVQALRRHLLEPAPALG
jgi:hypothetical protein